MLDELWDYNRVVIQYLEGIPEFREQSLRDCREALSDARGSSLGPRPMPSVGPDFYRFHAGKGENCANDWVGVDVSLKTIIKGGDLEAREAAEDRALEKVAKLAMKRVE